MRKIWSKKDKEKDDKRDEKRRSLVGNPPSLQQTVSNHSLDSSEKEHKDDVSTLAHSIQESHLTGPTVTTNLTKSTSIDTITTSSPKNLQSLVKFDYDIKALKASWANVIINTSANDINDHNLKLYRMELKGSHLLLYKPSLNYRRFSLSPRDDDASSIYTGKAMSVKNLDFDQPSPINVNGPLNISGPMSAPLPTSGSMGSHNETLQPPNNEIFKNANTSTNSILSPVIQSDNQDDLTILYWETKFPHPDLNINYDTLTFSLKSSSIEAILHLIFFQYEKPYDGLVEQAINNLPLLNNFGRTLRLLNLFLSYLLQNKFEGESDSRIIAERILKILNNINANFKGFLLKSDIAPYILKVLEFLNENTKDKPEWQGFLEDLNEFKQRMLSNQQDLIKSLSFDDDKLQNLNPLLELNSNYFLNNVNLIELVATINTIDLHFHSNWNSSIDKSLLLYSIMNDSTNSNDLFYRKNSLFFNNDFHIHYLSRLLINHLFLENPNTTSLNCTTTVLEVKARLLEKWIDLGCLLDKTGNMSSWLGISSIILSQPILRLHKLWTLVSPDYVKLLKNDWSPVLFELDKRSLVSGIGAGGSTPNSPKQQQISANDDFDLKDSYHIMAPRGLGKIYPKEKVIPYFGDLVINNVSIANLNELDLIFEKVSYSFSRWDDYLLNLNNFQEIIKYNDDVLKRYDSMGFIFSNESLNQVFYLGSNNDDSVPSTFKSITTEGNDSVLIGHRFNSKLHTYLLKLLELNSNIDNSFNLSKLMHCSLVFQPELPESYLTPKLADGVPLRTYQSNNQSNISLISNDSLPVPETEISPTSKLPLFNNNYFKINLLKYDELYLTNDSRDNLLDTGAANGKHNIKINDELYFRIDDFVSEFESNTSFNELEEVDENDEDDDEVPGLGIDVDDILNSEKFNNLFNQSDLEAKKATGLNDTKKSNSYSVVSSDSSQLQIYKYIPKFSSIDKLIDLLIVDSKYLDESINIDLTEYRFVFLLSYNAFMTTRELLEKLAHRFINSGNAVISIMKRIHLNKTGLSINKEESFPNWALDNAVDLTELGEVDYSLLLKIQINILKTLVVLLNNFYSNFAVDLINKKILIKLLKLFSNEILQWYNSNKIDDQLERSFENLVNYYKKLKKLFVKRTYRPIELSKFNEFLIHEFKFNNSLHEVPINRNLPGHKNVQKIEKFLHKFNKLLTVFYKGIKVEDWINVYKVLEVEFEKSNLLEYGLQKNGVSDESLAISNIFQYFDTLVNPAEKVLILKKFPLVFNKLFKIYNKFKTYIMVQLTDLNITVDERLDRMKTLLFMVKICRLKMAENQFVFEGTSRKSHKPGPIPSCIETAITNVILAPESRLFTNLWMKASNALNGEENMKDYDDLNSLLPKGLKMSDLAITHEPLLPCFGWIIENLLEVNKVTNFYRDLINFNKRYLVFKILKELTVEDFNPNEELTHNDTREFEFLLKLDENLVNGKNLKDFTLLERDRTKLFRSVLKDQHKLLIIDNRKKLLKESRDRELRDQSSSGLNLHHSNSSSSSLNSALNRKSSNPNMKRQSLSYKTNSSSRFKISGFFSKSRPFSLGGSSGSQHSPSGLSNGGSSGKVVDFKDLPHIESIEVKLRPVHIIPLKSKKIFPVYLMPLSFKIDSDSDGDDLFIQCTSDTELNDWLMSLNYANRHWFFSRTLNNLKFYNHHQNITFGVPLSLVCSRTNTMVPKFLVEMFAEIEKHGLKDVGIYRISTSISELTHIKSYIDKHGFINFEEKGYDTHALTSCIKSYFRELPDAILTDKVIEGFYNLRGDLINNDVDTDSMVANFKEILKDLPTPNYETFKALIKHLTKVIDHCEENKMTPTNVATVIGPALTESSSLEILVNNFGFVNFILEKILVFYSPIFDDEDIENSNSSKSPDTIKKASEVLSDPIPLEESSVELPVEEQPEEEHASKHSSFHKTVDEQQAPLSEIVNSN